ncbi:MAG: 4-alpha-glucanotransferase [Planctomycetes bacterium]|nr:4-alpha-glucanotransferase [Planctomycetota bacterium]
MATPIPRSSGVLLAVTSLPSRFGVGDLGPAARAWVEALSAAKQTWWQMLPVGPFGAGDSPYAAYSTFAGETLLISPEDLVADGLLGPTDLPTRSFSDGVADYDGARPVREALLRKAWAYFKSGSAPRLRAEVEKFVKDDAAWLDDWALYAAIKESRSGEPWTAWPEALRVRKPAAVERAKKELASSIDEHRFRQFLWFRQWTALRKHAAARGVKLLGDMPIFVAGDSCEAWSATDVFLFDADRRSTVVAGVPPDYFAKEGQLWGNPLYDWDALRRTGYDWWIRRAKHSARLFDLTRIDHFRAFQDAWYIPAGAKTAKEGKWVPGPRAPFFDALRQSMGGLPFLAEDLGIITDSVRDLREKVGLPGMRVLQFAFDGDPKNPFLPENYDPNTAVYTGTHDNDTTTGWWAALPDAERHPVRLYLSFDGRDVAWRFILLAWSSVASLAIAPLQDILILGSEARMNTPGLAKGNWRWRFTAAHPLKERLEGLRSVTEESGRSSR